MVPKPDSVVSQGTLAFAVGGSVQKDGRLGLHPQLVHTVWCLLGHECSLAARSGQGELRALPGVREEGSEF